MHHHAPLAHDRVAASGCDKCCDEGALGRHLLVQSTAATCSTSPFRVFRWSARNDCGRRRKTGGSGSPRGNSSSSRLTEMRSIMFRQPPSRALTRRSSRSTAGSPREDRARRQVGPRERERGGVDILPALLFMRLMSRTAADTRSDRTPGGREEGSMLKLVLASAVASLAIGGVALAWPAARRAPRHA